MLWPILLLLAGLVAFVVGCAMWVDSCWSRSSRREAWWPVALALLGLLASIAGFGWCLVLGYLWLFA